MYRRNRSSTLSHPLSERLHLVHNLFYDGPSIYKRRASNVTVIGLGSIFEDAAPRRTAPYGTLVVDLQLRVPLRAQ